MKITGVVASFLVMLLLPATPALAHPGHGAIIGFGAGFAHPLTGPDHVLAMLAVGLWAALAAPRLFWVAPLGFMAGMLGGGIAGMAGVAVPGVELMIAVSIVTFGVLAAMVIRLPAAVAFVAAAAFGSFHGMAHGAEMPETAAGITFALGFLTSSALLHGTGVFAGLMTQRLALARTGRLLGG